MSQSLSLRVGVVDAFSLPTPVFFSDMLRLPCCLNLCLQDRIYPLLCICLVSILICDW